MTTLEPGTRLHWYEIGKVLGQGSFGVTYAGLDTNLSQEVAIKEYFPQGECSRNSNGEVIRSGDAGGIFEWGLARFQEEAQLLARLRHPNVVRVLSVFPENGTAYMIMELERGSTLEDAIRLGLLDDEAALLQTVHALCDGLEHIHQAGVLHRDIKPENIILRSGGQPVLIDFGSARPQSHGAGQQMTTLVTRGYAPYEQYDAEPDAEQGPWSDLYALGATLYRVVARRHTPDALSRATKLLRGADDPLRPAASVAGDRYSEQLAHAIDRALAFDAKDRPQSMAEWRELLPGAPGVSPGAAPPPPTAASDDADLAATELLQPPAPAPTPAAAAPTEEDEPVPDVDLTGVRTLVVDDEPFIRNLTARILGRLGVDDITQAENGEQALGVLDSGAAPFDLILSDLNMPDMDGVALMRHLGERGIRAGVMLVSGEDSSLLQAAQQLAQAYDLNMLGTLQKPLKPENLKRLLADFKPPSDTTAAAPAAPAGAFGAITEQELLDGIAGDALRLVYQPKVAINGRKVVGVEALARWEHPERGLLGPGAFIPLAEETGHIVALTHAVFERAVADGGMWRVDGCDIGIAINFSMDTVTQLNLPEELAEKATANGVDTRNITIEVTESRVMRNVKEPLEVLTRLRLRGFGLSIDDFGTGHSTLEQVKRMPFSELKIDREFVFGAPEDESIAAMLRSSASLGKSLGLSVVAEGVETQAEWDLARECGCDVIQGYFVSKPIPADEIPPFIENWERG